MCHSTVNRKQTRVQTLNNSRICFQLRDSEANILTEEKKSKYLQPAYKNAQTNQ